MYRFQTSGNTDSYNSYLYSRLPSGGTATISVLDVKSGDASIGIDNNICSQISTIGLWKWNISGITIKPTTENEYVYVMTHSTGVKDDGVFRMGGYVDNIDVVSGIVDKVSGNINLIYADTQAIVVDTDFISGVTHQTSGNILTIDANVFTNSGNIVTLTGNVDIIQQFMSGDYIINIDTTPWQEEIYKSGTGTKLFQRKLYQADASFTNVTATTHIIGRKSGS